MLRNRYLYRPVDQRIINIIEQFLPKGGDTIDLGCGSGLYGKCLKEKSIRSLKSS